MKLLQDLDRGCLAVVTLGFGSHMMNTIFMFYYIKVFMERYHVTQAWFQLAQGLFMVWNAVNDPLFGFLFDIQSNSWLRNRRKVILYGAPYFAIAFLVPWFRWGGEDAPAWVTGMHLIFALWFYDGMLSFVLLAWSAMFAEFTTNHERRIRVQKYAQVTQVAGVLILPTVDAVSSSLARFGNFQVTCVAVAVVAYFCMRYTGTHAPDEIAHLAPSKGDSIRDEIVIRKESFWEESYRTAREIISNRNFLVVTAGNFFHICESTSVMNFSAIFTEYLVPDVVPKGTYKMSLFYGTSVLLPSLVALALSYPVAKVFGPYKPFMVARLCSVLMGLAMFVIGRSNQTLIVAFLILEACLCFAFYNLYNVFFSAVVDDDMVRHSRPKPVSGLVFSLNALFTKPAQSIAPMVVMYILHSHGYQRRDNATAAAGPTPVANPGLPDVMFTITCFLPVVLATSEMLAMRLFKLKQHHMTSQFDLFDPV